MENSEEQDDYEFTSKEYQDMKEQKDALVKEHRDFLIISGYNAGLEWAADWLLSALSGYPDSVVEFANANAMSIRAAKRTAPQENFFDAVRNDPAMTQEMKDYWLAQEPKEKYLCTFEDGTTIVLAKDEILEYQQEHKEAIFKEFSPYRQ